MELLVAALAAILVGVEIWYRVSERRRRREYRAEIERFWREAFDGWEGRK